MGLDGVAPDLMRAIPDGGYLRKYVEFGWETTMSPPEFHLAGGLAQMAVLMSNNVLVKGPGGRLYPTHTWFALVGSAGAARKTSGISLATDLLDEALGENVGFPSDTTREALWAALQERSTGYMVWSEFAGFLAKARNEYMNGIKEDLCEFWDSPPSVRRKLMKAEYAVSRPSVSILAGAVPERLVELIREQDLFGGFFSRFMFVTQVTPVPYRGLDWRGEERQYLWRELRRLSFHPSVRSRRIAEVDGAVRTMWEAYDQHLWGLPESQDPFVSGFFARSGVQALKLAFCYALARGSVQPEEQDMSNAMAFVDFCRRHARNLIAEAEANATREGRDLRKVRAAINFLARGDADWVAFSDLLQRTNFRARQLEEYLETLEEAGVVERRDVADGLTPRKEVRLT